MLWPREGGEHDERVPVNLAEDVIAGIASVHISGFGVMLEMWGKLVLGLAHRAGEGNKGSADRFAGRLCFNRSSTLAEYHLEALMYWVSASTIHTQFTSCAVVYACTPNATSLPLTGTHY